MKFKELFEAQQEFKHTVKFSNQDFSKWKAAAKKEKMPVEYDSQGKMELIYLDDKHIGTYWPETNELAADDLSLFGN